MTLKRILLSLAVFGAVLLIRQELRSRRQVEPEHQAAPAPEHRAASLDLATIPRPVSGSDCEAMWRDGQVDQAEAFNAQGLCPADFSCWTNRAGETLCGSDPMLEDRRETEQAARELSAWDAHLPAIASVCWREAGPGGGMAVCCPSPAGGDSCIPEWRYEQLLNTR